MELDRIYNSDCMVGIDSIEDGSIDLIVTDPPYLFDNSRWMSSTVVGERSILGKGSIYDPDGEIYQDMSQFSVNDIRGLLDKCVKKMKVVNMYLCCSETQVPIYGMWAREKGYHFGILTWEKPLSIINKNRFSTNTEHVVRIYDFGTALNKVENNEFYNKVIHTRTEHSKVHPTQKPVDMMQRFVLLSLKEGDTVLDPFMGSGTTAIACIRSKRRFIGFEKNEKFYKVAVERIGNETSQLTLF